MYAQDRVRGPGGFVSQRRNAPAVVPKGIELRHSRACASQLDMACDCSPKFRAGVTVSGSRQKLQRTFSTLAEAKLWRQDAVVDLRRKAISAVGDDRPRCGRGVGRWRSSGHGPQPVGRDVQAVGDPDVRTRVQRLDSAGAGRDEADRADPAARAGVRRPARRRRHERRHGPQRADPAARDLPACAGQGRDRDQSDAGARAARAARSTRSDRFAAGDSDAARRAAGS